MDDVFGGIIFFARVRITSCAEVLEDEWIRTVMLEGRRQGSEKDVARRNMADESMIPCLRDRNVRERMRIAVVSSSAVGRGRRMWSITDWWMRLIFCAILKSRMCGYVTMYILIFMYTSIIEVWYNN